MFFEEKITVTSIYVFDFGFYKNKSVFVPGRFYHSLSLRLGGRVSIECPEKSFVSTPGTLTYLPRGVSYNTEISEAGSAIGVHFTTAEEYDGLLPELIVPSYPVVFNNLYSELAARFKLGRENDLYCMSMFYGILAEARHEYLSKHGRIMNPRVKKAKDLIERGFSDPSLSVAELARQAQVSEVYFRKEFNSAVGISPAAYIKKTRIENAKSYLRTGLFSVTDVALKCGFDSISYFSFEFRRATGMTPRDYVKKYS